MFISKKEKQRLLDKIDFLQNQINTLNYFVGYESGRIVFHPSQLQKTMALMVAETGTILYQLCEKLGFVVSTYPQQPEKIIVTKKAPNKKK